MITISGVAVTRVRHAVEAGDDPLLMGAKPDPVPVDWTDRLRSLCEEAIDGMDAGTAARVATSLTTRLATARMGGNPDGVMPIDPLAARMMADQGIDPLAATWIATMTGMLDLDHVESGLIAGQMDGTCAADDAHNVTSIGLGARGTWRQKGELVLWNVPETLALAAVGRPLSAVVSHGVLDAEDITITDVDTEADGRKFVFATDYRPRPATISELIAAAPCGCR